MLVWFHLMAKGLVLRKRFCMGGIVQEFWKVMELEFEENGKNFRDLHLGKYCKRFFMLMDSGWVEMGGKYISMNSLVSEG